LGSNLGDRSANIRGALNAIEGARIERVSREYETEPWGVEEQPSFINVVAEIETTLEPLELLDAMKVVESNLGRGPSEKWGPRVIDIDIVLWGNSVIRTARLTIPHSSFRKRAFVLVPLAEIAPDVVDPETGLTVAELAALPEATGRVTLHTSQDH